MEQDMSERYFSRTGNGRSWRRGKFDLLVLPLADEKDAVFPEALWGTEALVMPDLPEHVSSTIYRTPEGMVAVSRCDKCGGRQEYLMDFRQALEKIRDRGASEDLNADPAFAEQLAQEVGDAIGSVASPFAREWFEKHENCAKEPVKHHVPSLVNDFIDSATRFARKLLNAGEQVLGHIYILLSDGRALAAPIHDLPEAAHDARARTIEVQRRFFSIREVARARKFDILAVVLFSEAWGAAYQGSDTPPPSATKQEEFLAAMLATESFGAVAISPIQRKGGVINEGPGDFEEFEWLPLVGEAQLVDGLLATTGLVSQSPEAARKGAGVAFTLSYPVS